jgi:hypothetical protein
MARRKEWLERTRRTLVAASLGLSSLMVLTLDANARGGHGAVHGLGGHGMHGEQFAGGRRRGNDNYVKAASEERDRLLNTQIKSICRGC